MSRECSKGRGSILSGRKSWRYIMEQTKMKNKNDRAECSVRLKIHLSSCPIATLWQMLPKSYTISNRQSYCKANKSLNRHSFTVKKQKYCLGSIIAGLNMCVCGWNRLTSSLLDPHCASFKDNLSWGETAELYQFGGVLTRSLLPLHHKFYRMNIIWIIIFCFQNVCAYFPIDCSYSVFYCWFIPSSILIGNGALIQFVADSK